MQYNLFVHANSVQRLMTSAGSDSIEVRDAGETISRACVFQRMLHISGHSRSEFEEKSVQGVEHLASLQFRTSEFHEKAIERNGKCIALVHFVASVIPAIFVCSYFSHSSTPSDGQAIFAFGSSENNNYSGRLVRPMVSCHPRSICR